MCKFLVISKWKLCCVWDNGKEFDNFWKGCLAKRCFLIQKFETIIGRVYLPLMFSIITFFFHNLTCWRYEGFKDKVVSVTFSLVCFVRLKDSTLTTRKNVFCSTSKALFVFEISYFNFSDIQMSPRHQMSKH